MIFLKLEDLVLHDTDLSGYDSEYNKIDGPGTKRNLSGTMRRQVIANKKKIYAKTKDFMTRIEMSNILKKITKDTLRIEYYDNKEDKLIAINCYCSPPKAEIDYVLNNEIFYKPIEMIFIEL